MPLGANKVALFGASADTGSAVLLSTATASSSASLEFTLPTAYKQVVFGFYNLTPTTEDGGSTNFVFQVNASGGSGFNETITSTAFNTYHNEADSDSLLAYNTGYDQAQGTNYEVLYPAPGNESDEGCVGELKLFNPASTTYVKHFYSTLQGNYYSPDYSLAHYQSGYINTTTNLSEISFKMSSGNISSGTIKMWGIK